MMMMMMKRSDVIDVIVRPTYNTPPCWRYI